MGFSLLFYWALSAFSIFLNSRLESRTVGEASSSIHKGVYSRWRGEGKGTEGFIGVPASRLNDRLLILFFLV
jgi:hypothetical protein